VKINIKPSFDRIYKKLPHSEKVQIDEKVTELFDYYNKDVLFSGLRVRKMGGKDNYFEIDTASNRRILIRKQKDLIELIAYGNHDEIRRFLKDF
jgi:mRNA-degrading endonuclease RelE of RelBE toxin-antitoxin system